MSGGSRQQTSSNTQNYDQRQVNTYDMTSYDLSNRSTPVEAGGYKMLSLYGRTADGVDLQSNAIMCPTGTVECH